MLKCGIDRVSEFRELFTGRVALVTSPTGRDAAGRPSAEVLRKICDLRLLLAPEHGIRGDRAAGEAFGADVDEETGLQVLSLYSGESKRLPKEAFELADTIVYDIQDVGCRYYTFISTLKMLAEDCAAHQKRLIVLDRPNPLGDRVEGTLLQEQTRSFVGCWQIPAVYDLTCGEFAQMIDCEENLDCDLHIIPCTGWHRGDAFPAWGREWVKPSPNIPNYETALLYPGTCLIEGTNLSEGRGTEAPFAILGAPFVDGEELSHALHFPGVSVEPIRFVPTASKHAGIECGGIRLRITDADALRPVELGIRLLKTLMQLYPGQLEWAPGDLGIPFLSQLAGTREWEAQDWDAEALIRRGREESARFREKTRQYQLYD